MVMNASPETMLACTSGTSGRVALLPTTPEMSKTFFSRGILVLFDVLARRGHLDHLQRSCKLTFAATPRATPAGLRIGPNSSGPKDRSFAKLRPILYVRRAVLPPTGRGDAAAATRMVRGDERRASGIARPRRLMRSRTTRRPRCNFAPRGYSADGSRRGHDVDIPRRRVAATPGRGYLV